jgi:predicted hotdog family 3-hydroxylacyl-ACP dehydratase
LTVNIIRVKIIPGAVPSAAGAAADPRKGARPGRLGVTCRPVVFASLLDRDLLRRRRSAVAVLALVLLLALVETGNALVAPWRAATDEDWRAAAARIRAEFRPGDLIVTSPAWADPVLRLRLGDLVPRAAAARMDSARYGRIWEIAQRGARAPESRGARQATTARFGALTVRRWEKTAAVVSYDFLAEWRQATLAVVRPDGTVMPCTAGGDKFQCPGTTLGPDLLEIDTTLRNGFLVEPVENATLALEFPAVAFGRELAVASGLHNVWQRKSGDGKVRLRVLAGGRELGTQVAASQSGWTVQAFDTAALAGTTGPVRFEITVDKAHARYLGFAAEARSP